MLSLQKVSLRAQAHRIGVALAALFSLSGGAHAHVGLDSPNGGETLAAGSTFAIQWQPTVEHDTTDWDLWYSVESADGPWLSIATDLPLGDPTAGAIHLFDWTVPNIAGDAWVRVRQDNTDTDYYDVSDASFSILAGGPAGDFNNDGLVDAADYAAWRNGLGPNYDGADYDTWRANYGASAAAGQGAAVPEPAAWVLAGLVMAAAPRRRR